MLLSDLEEPPPTRTDPAVIRALARELSKVGTNFNQLARCANEAAKIGARRRFAVLMVMEAELRVVAAQIADTVMHVIEL